MNKLDNIFNKNLIIGNLVFGDNSIEESKNYIFELIKNGVDILTITVPFSDPVVENEIMINAHLNALKNGICLEDIFQILESIKNKIDIPILLFSYLNPIFNYKYENFIDRCKETNISGLIIPDLPYESKDEIQQYIKDDSIYLIPFIAMDNMNRTKEIVDNSNGFAYLIPNKNYNYINNFLVELRKYSNLPIVIPFVDNSSIELLNIVNGIMINQIKDMENL